MTALIIRPLVLTLLIVATSTAWAALPIAYQNQKDLRAMIHYINKNMEVSMMLKEIDFTKRIVYYGNCKAYFSRKVINRAPGWVGPAAPLAFSHKKCKVETIKDENNFKGSSQVRPTTQTPYNSLSAPE